MRTSLACALVAAVATAQSDYDYYNETPYEEYPETNILDQIIEVNENGNYALNFDFPNVEVSQWDEEQVRAWAEQYMADGAEIEGDWAAAWQSYQDAVAQPWNDFVSKAETIFQKGHEVDVQANEDVINFVAENIYVNGESLQEKFPQISEYLATVRQEADNMAEMFNLDALRVTKDEDWSELEPKTSVTLLEAYYKEECEYEEDGSYGCVGTWVTVGDQILEKIGEQVISYGFDPTVVEEWFQNNGETWQEINQRHEQEAAEVAKVQVQQASDYVQNIIDNAVVDMKNKVSENRSELEQMLDERAAEYKYEIERQTNSTIANIENFFEDAFNTIDESVAGFNITEAQNDDYYNDDWMVLASKDVQQESAGYSYMGFAAVALGAVATVAYLAKKKQEKTVTSTEETLLDDDEQFVMV